MAVNVNVYNLESFPNNSKIVTVDLSELVPYGNNGEDAWVLSANTTATAAGSAVIQKMYISDTKWGWLKSSGINSGPYTINASQQNLRISIDEVIGSGAEITLATSALQLGGDTVAKDLQSKISSLALAGQVKEGMLSYLNVSVEYKNGRFIIISGTASSDYVGADSSFVEIADGVTTTGLAAELGFDIVFSSQTIAGEPVKSTSLTAVHTAPSADITVAAPGVLAVNDCVAILDGVNKEFRHIDSIAGSVITLNANLANSYGVGTLVQVMDVRDPTGIPSPAYETIDEYIRFSLASLINQIDFSG